MVVALSTEESPNVEWCKALQIPLTTDLVEAAKKQLRFLAAVDSTDRLYDGPAVERAIYRYKYCWLPLLAKHIQSPILEGPLIVPLDCEWIWHCHRLNPVQYKRDCEEIYGRILDTRNVMSTCEGASSKQTEVIWRQIYGSEPYYMNPANVLNFHGNGDKPDAEVQKDIDYDLIEAIERQSSFFPKVCRLLHCDDSFLEDSVNRYKAFLHLIKKLGPRRGKYSCVPTHDIDLIWHTHQLNPTAYSKDLTPLFGAILDHNDRDSTGSYGRKKLLHGFGRTKQIWESTYNCEYNKEIKGVNGSLPERVATVSVDREAEDKICWYNCWPQESGKIETYSDTF